MREQPGVPARFPQYADVQTQGDDPEDDEVIYTTRLPSSARRYAAPTTAPPRTVMRVTRHQGPPPPIKRASRIQAPAYAQPQQAPVQSGSGGLSPLVYIGLAMLIMVIGWIMLSSLTQWWQNQQDTWKYGYPRTFQMDADVRHGGMSHFTVENLQGHILILEMQINNLAKARIYQGPVFSGAGTDLQPAMIRFEDVNGDGYPDMVIAVGTGRYVLINTHTGFRPSTATDTMTGKGV